MTKQAVVSKDSGKEYELYIHNGKAVGCTCEYRKYHTFVSCKHMTVHNAPKLVAPEVLWSEVCGHRVRSDVHQHCGCMA